MARRLHKTLADYIVIGLSPALIMALIGSFVFFLVAVFYRGQFVGRLHWVLALFIMGAVLIGRISIEEGREHASLFAAPLAVAALLAMMRFLDAHFAASCSLLVLIWWCADKLTWDCTWIDEQEEDSGQGVLQSAGLEPPPGEGDSGRGEQKEGEGQGERSEEAESGGVRSESPGARQGAGAVFDDAAAWWRRFLARRRRAHAPGVWVVYLSLAALPAFGFGQRLVPDQRRGYTFLLLAVFVASALGLLLTSSFLGMRRYLRQRRVEMPVEMAGLWLGVGCALIATVLALAALPPRPSGWIMEPPLRLASKVHLRPSAFSAGHEGVEDKERRPTSETSPDKSRQPEPGRPKKSGGAGSDHRRPQNGSGERRAGENRSNGHSTQRRGETASGGPPSSPNPKRPEAGGTARSKPADHGRSGPDRHGESGQADSQGPADSGRQAKNRPDTGDSRKTGGAPSRQTDDGQSTQPGETRREEPERRPSTSGRSSQSPASQGQAGAARRFENQRPSQPEKPAPGAQPKGEGRRAQEGGSPSTPETKSPESAPSNRPTPTPRPSSSPHSPTLQFGHLISGLARVMKALFYMGLLAVIAVLLWVNRETLRAAAADFIRQLRELWRRLFGGDRETEAPEEAAETATSAGPRPFADYPDPFLSGRVDRRRPEQLVRYTFEALEAWSREHGCPRDAQQTPLEFADRLGAERPTLARDVRNLAVLYNQAAYSASGLPPSTPELLEPLWRRLRSEPSPEAASVAPSPD